VYRSNRQEGARATDILADYAADQPHALADLLMDADDKQFAVIYPILKEHGEAAVAHLSHEISEEIAPPPVISDWTVRFHKWDDAGKGKPPADWNAVLKSPILDELRVPRLYVVIPARSPRPRLPGFP
jgi:hypothetical protein